MNAYAEHIMKPVHKNEEPRGRQENSGRQLSTAIPERPLQSKAEGWLWITAATIDH